jgi:hypothetical protein
MYNNVNFTENIGHYWNWTFTLFKLTYLLTYLLTSFVGVIRDSKYTNSLTTSKCLSPIATLCPTSRIVISFRAAIIYFVFCSFIFNPTLAASSSNAKYERLTDSYRRYLYHRHMRVVVFLC